MPGELDSVDVWPGSPGFDLVWCLYEESFPREERRDGGAQEAAHGHAGYRLRAWFEGGEFAGLTGTWRWRHWLFLDHFAVASGRRGSGLGSAILDSLKRELGGAELLVLEIEPPVDETSRRREKFYLGNEFVASPWRYVSRSYVERDGEIEFVFMSYPGLPEVSDFREFMKYHAEVVMGETVWRE